MRMPPPKETAIQAATLEHWLKLGLPNTLVAAIPNAFAHGQPGLTPGLPDLMVLGPHLPGGVGFIELKRDGHSKPSAGQIAFARLCAALGITIELAYGRDEPIAILEQWGIVRRAAA